MTSAAGGDRVAAVSPIQADSVDDLVSGFRQALEDDGNPSLRDLARRIERDLEYGYGGSPSTLSRVFNGQQLPRWTLARAILRALSVSDDEIATTWRRRWVRARTRWNDPNRDTFIDEEPSDALAADDLRPSGQECEACGAWVTNMDRHDAWHKRVEDTGQQRDESPERPGRTGRWRLFGLYPARQ
jgi:hypothetical protein